MNEIRELTSKFCLNISSDPRLLQETIRQSFKDLCSLSKQMKSLADYGPILMSRKFFEPVSPGGSSPCHSDNCLDDDEEKSRIVEPSLYEVAEIFLDASAIIEISQTTQNSNWCLWIMICGLQDEGAFKGLLALVEKHVPNVQYETCKKVVYKGQTSFVLHFKEHFTTQKVFSFLKEDFYAKTYIKDRWQIFRFYNRMDDPKYMSQFFGVILQNLPLDCTSQTIIDLVTMHSSNISVLSVEIPTLIGDSFCSFIRTKTLEDAEILALTLNSLGNIRAGLHPSCNFKHQNFDKDPFKDIKIDHHLKKIETQAETGKDKKNDIKSLLSLFKSELKTRAVEVRENSIAFDNRQRMMPQQHQPFPHHPQQFPPRFFEPMPRSSFGYNGPPPQGFPRNPAMFYGPPPQRWVPPNFQPHPDYHHPPVQFPPIQKFGKKIQKTFLKPTRASNKNNRKSPKKQPKPDEIPDKTEEIPQFISNSEAIPEKKKELPLPLTLTSPSSSNNHKRSFVESIQNGNKHNLEKVFDRKLADWNIGVYQVKSNEKPQNNSLSVSKWKITCGTSSSVNNKLPSYLENMMDGMINPVNTKRKFESLYPNEKNDKIQRLKSNIQEFQKKSDEIGDPQRFSSKNRNKQRDSAVSSSSDEEKELNLGPQKKQYLETFTREIPNYGEPPPPLQKEEKKINLNSLGWSIKSSSSNSKKKDLTPPPPVKENPIPKETEEKKTTPPTTNIVFNGPYVQSSNLNYMYLPHLLMGMNHQHHQQTPVIPNSFSFNPQMMVYHNNFILNPLVPCHGQQQSFWNAPMPQPQESVKNIEQAPKKLNDWTPPKSGENLPSVKNKANDECPEPESTPPVLPNEPPQETRQGKK